MAIAWPLVHMSNGDMDGDVQQPIRDALDRLGDAVESGLATIGLPKFASPMFQPFSLAVLRDAEKVIAAFSRDPAGMPTLSFIDRPTEIHQPRALVDLVVQQTGRAVHVLLDFIRPDLPNSDISIQAAAHDHVRDVERANALGKLGDLQGVTHLEPQLRQFLAHHPDFDRNVFVMMRFTDTAQMKEIYSAIRDTLAGRGMHAVRADDRDYTGELWSNIEVYLTCCKYGIAVFEALENPDREFNPNVSLELGYMLGRRKRTLLLKEKRLPDLPADVVHRLYKPFDMFDISNSIAREVGRWVDVDLGLKF